MQTKNQGSAYQPQGQYGAFHDLAAATRTCRRFREDVPISITTLHHLVDLARLAGSARNGQPWQYMAVNDPQQCDRIFPYLGWAGYLADWIGPAPGERPPAYILCFLNRKWLKVSEREAFFDLGIASQNLLLGAAAQQILGCRIGAFSPVVAKLWDIPEHLHLALIIALGRPLEQIVLEVVSEEENIRYWRDEQQVHHVPKRTLQDVLLEIPTKTKK